MIQIKEDNTLENLIIVLNKIPEFSGDFTFDYLERRLQKHAIILVAYADEEPVACKVGYNRFFDGSFYSWLGGVIPEYRKKGIAEKLNLKMEEISKNAGYTSLIFKTRNKFKAMLQFGLKNGYEIVGFEEKTNSAENRIILKKQL